MNCFQTLQFESLFDCWLCRKCRHLCEKEIPTLFREELVELALEKLSSGTLATTSCKPTTSLQVDGDSFGSISDFLDFEEQHQNVWLLVYELYLQTRTLEFVARTKITNVDFLYAVGKQYNFIFFYWIFICIVKLYIVNFNYINYYVTRQICVTSHNIWYQFEPVCYIITRVPFGNSLQERKVLCSVSGPETPLPWHFMNRLWCNTIYNFARVK